MAYPIELVFSNLLSMADPLTPFIQQLTGTVLLFVIPATVIATLIGAFKKDLEGWLIRKIREAGAFARMTRLSISEIECWRPRHVAQDADNRWSDD